MHALQSDPEGLRTRRVGSFSIDIAAELGHQPYKYPQGRRLGRRVFTPHHLPDRFPFGRLENRIAIDLRATASQAANVQRSPSNNHIHGQTRKQTVHVFEQPLFHSAAGFQHAKENFYHPPHTVVLDDLSHLLYAVDRQARQKQPFDRLVAGRRTDFTDQHDIHGHRRKFAVRSIRRTQRHAGRAPRPPPRATGAAAGDHAFRNRV